MQKKSAFSSEKARILVWEQRESNPRPSACKADALNQLSYAPVKELFPEWDCKYRYFFFTSNNFGKNFVYICSPFQEGLFFCSQEQVNGDVLVLTASDIGQ